MNKINKYKITFAFVFFLFLLAIPIDIFADGSLIIEGKEGQNSIKINSIDMNIMPISAHSDSIVNVAINGEEKSFLVKGIDVSYLLLDFCGAKLREADVLFIDKNRSSITKLFSELSEKSNYYLVYDIKNTDGTLVKEFENKGFALLYKGAFIMEEGDIFFLNSIKINTVLTIKEATKEVPEFTDITADYEYAKNAIYELVKMDVISGVSDSEFAPETPITRAELAKLLTKALKLNEITYQGNYSDLSKDNPYANYIATVVYEGLLNGYTDGTFAPENTINRQEFAALCSKILIKLGKITEGEIEKYTLNEADFTDYDSVFGWVENSIAYLNSLGIYEAYLGDTFSPLTTSSRAETVYIIYSLLFK